jgi:hypothetical protein
MTSAERYIQSQTIPMAAVVALTVAAILAFVFTGSIIALAFLVWFASALVIGIRRIIRRREMIDLIDNASITPRSMTYGQLDDMHLQMTAAGAFA